MGSYYRRGERRGRREGIATFSAITNLKLTPNLQISITDLSLYVHECDSVATVTDDKLVVGLWQYVYGVDGDVSLRSRQTRLEGISTLCSLQVP